MASLQKTYSGDLSTSIASQLWSARNVASAARQESQGWADKNPDLVKGINPMFGRGQIFARELQRRATSGLPKRFQRQLLGPRDYWARGQGIVDPLMGVGKGTKSGGALRLLPEYQKLAHPDERAYRSNANKVPKAPTTTNTKTREKGVVVKDQQLGNFLAAVALSLSSSLNSINKKLDDTSEGVIAAKDGIDATHKKLEQHSDSLESKLDDIINALRFSNQKEKELKDQREFEAKKTEDKKAADFSTATSIIMNDMDRQEIRDKQAEDLAEDDRGPIGDPWEDPKEQQLNIPGLEEGGIVSGPDSGYLAVLHGDEAVVPLDNNYTQGQPSAVGKESMANMPMLPRAEMGIDNPSTMKPNFTRNTAPNTPLIKSSFSMDSGQNLADAIQLPSKAAGIVTMGIMGKVMNQVSLPPDVIANMKSITTPIASAFGVPDAISSGVEKRNEADYMAVQGRRETLTTGKGKQFREKGVFERIKDFIFGTGGGNVSYRGGTGGNTYINNRSTGTGGGYGGNNVAFNWGNPVDKMKFDPANPDRENPHPPGTMLYNIWQKRLQQYNHMKEAGMISSAGGDNQFFTKNLSYENAYDYRKFDSPEYGLRTSEVAYNMSMDDEVNSIAEGMSDPSKSEIIAHNQTALNTNEKQMEISPITNRGNPLKDGIYLGAYSV